MYKVIRAFADAHDHERIYHVGDVYPREGIEVDAERLKELSSNNNRCGVALIRLEGPEEGPSEAKGGPSEVETGVRPSAKSEAKEKPRKGQRRHDRTDPESHT